MTEATEHAHTAYMDTGSWQGREEERETEFSGEAESTE